MRKKQAKSRKVTEAEALQHFKGLSDKLVDLPQNSPGVEELRDAIERARKTRQFGYLELEYLNKVMTELLKNRPQVLQHGDYHIGNFMIGEDREIYVIDFDCFDVGDPWEEFNRIVWSAQVSPAFASGMIDGYFDDKVPDLFWKLLAVYILSNLVGALPWAFPYGEEEVSVMQNQAIEILEWYDDMKQIIPSWYLIKKKVE